MTSAATPDYIAANGSTISLGGLVGNYTANGSGDGFLRDCTVTDLTLASVNPGVYMSYIAGGIRGNLPSLPASPWVQSGNRIAGSCTGANVSAAAAEGIYYPSLALAVEAVVNSSGKSGTVTLLNDAQGGGIGLFNGKGAKGVDLTIDFGGNTYTCVDPAVGSAGTESQGFHLEAGNKVTLKNGTIQVAEESTKTVMLIQNYCDLTLQNLTLVGADKTEYILSCNYGDISLERVNIFGAHSGLVGIDLMHWIGSYPSAPSMTIKNTSENLIEGSIEVYCYQSGVGVIEDCREPAVLTILGGRFSADPTAYLPEGYQVTGSGPYLVSRVPAPAPTPDQSKDERPSAPAVTPAVTPAATPLPDSQAAQPPVGQQRPAPTATPAPTQSEPAQVTTVAQAQVTEKTAVVTLEKEAFTQVVNQAVTQGKANGASPLVTVEVAQDQEAQAVQVTLPAQALETLSQQEGAALTFTSQVAQVTFDAPALAAIARQAEEEVRLVVAPVAQDQMTPAQVQAAGDYPTFELTLHSGEAVISSFEEGNATVTLPYTLAQGQEAQGIVVWYLDQEGTLTPCQTSYDPEAGQVTFVTPHFSRYVIGYDESLLSRADLNLPVQEEAPAEASEATFPLPLVAAVAALVAAAMVLLGRKFLLRED